MSDAHNSTSRSGIYIGIDLGGTSTRAAVGRRDGTLVAAHKLPTPAAAGPSHVVDAVVEAARLACDHAGITLEEVDAWGVAAPGPVDRHDGSVYDPPNLPGWRTVPLQALLHERTGKRVSVGNDANLAGVAEWRHGAG